MIGEIHPSFNNVAHSLTEIDNTREITVDKQWVERAVLQSVRLNSESNEIRRFPCYRELPAEFRTDFNPAQLEVSPIAPDRRAGSTSDEVLSVLLNSNIRRGNRALIDNHIPALKQSVDHMVHQEAPIKIILPTLPFKDQNPLTTRHSLGEVDLGEYLHFAQLRNICASLEAIYTPGARFILLTDGLIYADFFADGKREQIERYSSNCERIISELGLQRQVTIMDMEWLVQREPQFSNLQRNITSHLEESVRENPETAQAVRSLQQGMLLNLPMPSHDFDSYASLISQSFDSLPLSLQDRTYDTAITYASFLLTMRRLHIVERNFPGALRATVHPKNAPQLPLHLVNKHSVTFPYNGVPVVSESKLAKTGSLGKSTRILRFYQILEKPNIKAIYQPRSSEPFYYLSDR